MDHKYQCEKWNHESFIRQHRRESYGLGTVLSYDTKSWSQKKNNNKLNLINTKSFCYENDPVKRVKIYELGDIFAIHNSHESYFQNIHSLKARARKQKIQLETFKSGKKKFTIPTAGEDIEWMGLSYFAGGNMKWYIYSGKIFGSLS